MSLLCLGIAGSPRNGGNTDFLLKRALEGAASAGATTEFLALRDFKFAPCIGCNGCFKEGQCVVKDEMQHIYPKLLSADRIILAAPIFSMGMNALAKAAVDRCQRFWATKYILKKKVIEETGRPQRRGIYISVAGSNLPHVFDGAQQVANYFFHVLEVENTGSYLYRKVDDRSDILKHPDYLQEVYDAGFALGQP